MKNRLKTLTKIDKLQEKHCSSCEFYDARDNTFCIRQCLIGKELKGLGNELFGSRDEKVAKILEKGADITTNDVVYLVENGVSRKDITQALGMNTDESIEVIEGILNNTQGNDRNIITDTEEVTLNSPGYQEYLKLKDKGMSLKEMSKTTGYKETTLSNYAHVNRKFNRVNNLPDRESAVKDFKKDKNTEQENKVIDLSKQGLKPREIVRKTGIDIGRIYYIRSQNKQEIANKGSVDKVAATENNNKIKSLENKLQEANDMLNEAKKEKEELEIHCKTLKEDYNTLLQSKEKQRLEMQQRNDELIAESRETIELIENKFESMKKDFEIEVKKHDTLFNYLLLQR